MGGIKGISESGRGGGVEGEEGGEGGECGIGGGTEEAEEKAWSSCSTFLGQALIYSYS
eukprot:TRINITY_DN6406_c0_g1_i1.p2 TRINITY_DN6406_c0_g1~~TRINITY_DN6406_c0_g1_i1.p2  ORF type:complete len:58 (-),score=14.93 TRINITY_DN6406_c0_g1_i1:98-271(-)